MPKVETRYVCQNCGAQTLSWMGKCPECGEWNSLAEEARQTSLAASPAVPLELSPLNEILSAEASRLVTTLSEFDRVLGGGIVPGSVVLLAGDPGIGKSTLVLQAAGKLALAGKRVLYVSGEESPRQIKLRADRLKISSDQISVLPATDLFQVSQQIDSQKPDWVVIDSIQTLSREDLASAPGSVGQVRECAHYLVRLAKSLHVPLIIIGHVTKEGAVAGPRVLEHLVDTVLYFEGDPERQYRILRTTKNRFGPTSEVGIFEMGEDGLLPVLNPSNVFLKERSHDAAGSVITVTMEGTRPLLVEVQALVSRTPAGFPKRTVTGLDYNRTSIIIAVLERRSGLKLFEQDIYLNVAGGLKVMEPAADLAVAAAIASCYKNKPIGAETVVLGEVGLGGEVRSVNRLEARLMEAQQLGFKRAVISQSIKKSFKGLEVITVSTVAEALQKS